MTVIKKTTKAAADLGKKGIFILGWWECKLVQPQ
jgi:hypothetical protein